MINKSKRTRNILVNYIYTYIYASSVYLIKAQGKKTAVRHFPKHARLSYSI